MATPRVPEDTRVPPVSLFPQGSIRALDAGAYSDFSPLPAHERSRIVDRSGKVIPESAETSESSGRHILAALDFNREEHIIVSLSMRMQRRPLRLLVYRM